MNLKLRTPRFFGVLIVCTLGCGSANAVPISLDFGGHLFAISDATEGSPSLRDDSSYTSGDAFLGHITYATEAPVSSIGGNSYHHRGAIIAFSIDFGQLGQIQFDTTLVTDSSRQFTSVSLSNGSTPRFSASTHSRLLPGSNSMTFTGEPSLLQFGSNSSQALSAWTLTGANINTIADAPFVLGQLPIPLSIADLTNGTGGAFSLRYAISWTNPASGNPRNGSFSVSGRITHMSLSPAAVPEPNSFALIILMLFGASVWKGRGWLANGERLSKS